GVNTFIVSQSGGNEGLGFAIPSATTRTVFKQLKEHGLIRRQEIGVSLQTISPVMASSLKLPKDYGVIVSDVWPGGPAKGAVLQIGDILVSVDGQPADNLPTVIYNFRLRDSSDKVQLVVLRGTTQQTLSVQTIEMRAELDAVSAMADPERNLVPEIGILGVEIDARIAAAASGLRAPYGVIVAARASGALVDVPLQANDVTRSVNDRKVATLAQLREVLRALPPGAPVTLQVQREGRLTYVSFTFDLSHARSRAVQGEHGVQQRVGAVGAVVPARQLFRRVTDAGDAPHEDHAHREEERPGRRAARRSRPRGGAAPPSARRAPRRSACARGKSRACRPHPRSRAAP